MSFGWQQGSLQGVAVEIAQRPLSIPIRHHQTHTRCRKWPKDRSVDVRQAAREKLIFTL
jgi:hypothetical protein